MSLVELFNLWEVPRGFGETPSCNVQPRAEADSIIIIVVNSWLIHFLYFTLNSNNTSTHQHYTFGIISSVLIVRTKTMN